MATVTMVRGALFVMGVMLLAALANVQARNFVRSSSNSHHHDHSGPPSEVASSIAQQIKRSDLGSLPIPYTKKFYITFGPYYAENPLSINDKSSVRQLYEADGSTMPIGMLEPPIGVGR